MRGRWSDVVLAIGAGVILTIVLVGQSSQLHQSQIRASATLPAAMNRVFTTQIRDPKTGDPMTPGLYFVKYQGITRVAIYEPGDGDYRWAIMDVSLMTTVDRVEEWRKIPE